MPCCIVYCRVIYNFIDCSRLSTRSCFLFYMRDFPVCSFHNPLDTIVAVKRRKETILRLASMACPELVTPSSSDGAGAGAKSVEGAGNALSSSWEGKQQQQQQQRQKHAQDLMTHDTSTASHLQHLRSTTCKRCQSHIRNSTHPVQPWRSPKSKSISHLRWFQTCQR